MMKRRILFLLSSLKFGGAEKHTINLINRLDKTLFEMGLCYLEPKEELIEELVPNALSLKHCCNKKRRFEIRVLSCITNQIRHFKPDIVVCVDPYPGFYAYVVKFINNLNFKMIHVLHQTITPSTYNELISTLLYRHTINKSDLVVFVCDNQMDYWIDKYKINRKKCKRIYNGIDIDHFHPARVSPAKMETFEPPFPISDDDIVIGICAVLRPEKKHADLIKAFKNITDAGRSAKLLIIGDGPERNTIEKQIDNLKINERVCITGYQKDVRPYMALCHLMAITSVAVETFSIAVLEAMAMAKPIIASDIGGSSEQVIEGVNGYTFPAGNIDDLTRQLSKLMDRSTLVKMGIESRKIVVEKFSEQRMITLYNKTFKIAF